MQAGLVRSFVSSGRVVTASSAPCTLRKLTLQPLARGSCLRPTVRKLSPQVARSASQPMEDELLTSKVKDNSKVVPECIAVFTTTLRTLYNIDCDICSSRSLPSQPSLRYCEWLQYLFLLEVRPQMAPCNTSVINVLSHSQLSTKGTHFASALATITVPRIDTK